jgi:predicted RND superfamily exporter protein
MLTIVTCNMLIAFWAIFSVGMILVSVIAVMVYQGWEMGVSESISVVMLIGLSVDYIVHLA